MAERNLDFDRVIDRRNTRSVKYDFAKQRGMPEGLLPMWVADMDFKTSSYIEDALVERARDAIFGYSDVQTPYFEIVRDWMKQRHGWDVKESWLVKTPGVVFALAIAVKAYTEPGDVVLVQQPGYYPFVSVSTENGRRVVSSDLHLGEDNRYHIDFDDFEKRIVEDKIKLFIMCNPHNPVGRVWTADELTRIGDICVKHHVTVVSDEIHADFAFKRKHVVFAGLKKEFADIAVTCTAPSKTFNLAGLMMSNIFIANDELRDKFKNQIRATGTSQLGVMGLVACEAAYSKGGEWYEAVCEYIKANVEFTKKYVEENMPGVRMVEHEGSYLVWIDFRGTGIDADALEELVVHKAKLWLDGGRMFGANGSGFQRINVACPRSVLEEALCRLKNAVCG